jgi:hypothetical protein
LAMDSDGPKPSNKWERSALRIWVISAAACSPCPAASPTTNAMWPD